MRSKERMVKLFILFLEAFPKFIDWIDQKIEEDKRRKHQKKMEERRAREKVAILKAFKNEDGKALGDVFRKNDTDNPSD